MNQFNLAQFPPTLNPHLFNAEGDRIDYTIYDRLELDNASGPIEREFFSQGVNEDDPVTGTRKTKADTNFRGGLIPEGQSFGTFIFRFLFESENILTEAQKLAFNSWVHTTVMEFNIESKNEYGTWKLTELFGNTNDTIVTAGATGQAASDGRAIYSGMKVLNLAIPLPRLTDVHMNMIQYAASPGDNDGDYIGCYMVGIKNRAG